MATPLLQSFEIALSRMKWSDATAMESIVPLEKSEAKQARKRAAFVARKIYGVPVSGALSLDSGPARAAAATLEFVSGSAGAEPISRRRCLEPESPGLPHRLQQAAHVGIVAIEAQRLFQVFRGGIPGAKVR